MTRAIGPAIPRPMRRCRITDAQDVAAELVEAIVTSGAPHALFVLPNNEFRYAPERHPNATEWGRRWPFALVGVYTREAWAKDIVDDILSMPEAT